jgi:hypothetical protein
VTAPVLAVSIPLITSVIAAVASLAGAAFTVFWGQRIKHEDDEQLERLKSKLLDWQGERNAQRDYRYEAMKRLYTDLQPLLFQLAELCDSAYLHTRGLARTARNGNLGAGPQSWLDDPEDDYYLLSTVYRVLVPVAVIELMRRRLTFVDLTVDQELAEQYRFARALASTWNSGFDIAGKDPELAYRPHDPHAASLAAEAPGVYGLQHLYAGEVDAVASCLVVADPDGRVRPRTYGEFEEAHRQPAARDRVAPAVELFTAFHPRTHPVLWRMLVVHAHLYRAVARTFGGGGGVVAPAEGLPPEERSKFDWREPGAAESEEEAVEDPFRGALAYLSDVLGRVKT